MKNIAQIAQPLLIGLGVSAVLAGTVFAADLSREEIAFMQRKQGLWERTSVNVGAGAGTRKAQYCVADGEDDEVLDDHKPDPGCAESRQLQGNTMKWASQCKDENGSSQVEIVTIKESDELLATTSTMSMSAAGKTITTKSTIKDKWLGKDCGSVSTNGVPPIPGAEPEGD